MRLSAVRLSSLMVEVAAPPIVHFAGVGPLQKAGQMQKRRLSGARRRDQRHRLARRELERRAVQDLDRRVAPPVAALDRVERSAAIRA